MTRGSTAQMTRTRRGGSSNAMSMLSRLTILSITITPCHANSLRSLMLSLKSWSAWITSRAALIMPESPKHSRGSRSRRSSMRMACWMSPCGQISSRILFSSQRVRRFPSMEMLLIGRSGGSGSVLTVVMVWSFIMSIMMAGMFFTGCL